MNLYKVKNLISETAKLKDRKEQIELEYLNKYKGNIYYRTMSSLENRVKAIKTVLDNLGSGAVNNYKIKFKGETIYYGVSYNAGIEIFDIKLLLLWKYRKEVEYIELIDKNPLGEILKFNHSNR